VTTIGALVRSVTIAFIAFTRRLVGEGQTVPVPTVVTPRRWSIASQLLLLQAGLAILVVAVAVALAYVDARRDTTESARATTEAVARAVADTPDVASALADPDPSATLQPFAESVRRDTGTDFVVVMAPDRTRYSHPNPEQLGKPFIGTIAPALRGETFSEVFQGTLGPSVRTVTPVRDPAGNVIGLVAVGITIEQVGTQVQRQLPTLGVAAAVVLGLAVLGALLVSRRLGRLTYGLGAEQLSRMYGYYDAVLHSVREGLLLLDSEGRIQLVNDEARRLLGLSDDVVGRHVDDVGLPTELSSALASADAVHDELHLTADRVVVVNASAAVEGGRVLGRVVTLRDRTDLQALTGELDAARGLAEALRSQAHESANRLHTVVSLIELGRPDDAVAFAVEELQSAQALADHVVAAVEEPVVAAVLLGKSAVAAERGVELVVTPQTDLDADALTGAGLSGRDVVTVLGNLLDNAIDAAADPSHPTPPGERRVLVEVGRDDAGLRLMVQDTGPGLDPAAAANAFERGWSTKSADGERLHGRGLGLALVGQTVHRLGGTITVESEPGQGATFVVRLPLRAGVRAP
jgi:two-component system, CitB family, sensor kinase